MAGAARIWNEEEKGEVDGTGGGLASAHLADGYYECLAVWKASGQPAGREQSWPPHLTSWHHCEHLSVHQAVPPVRDKPSQESPCCPTKEHHEAGLEAIVSRAHTVLRHKEGG